MPEQRWIVRGALGFAFGFSILSIAIAATVPKQTRVRLAEYTLSLPAPPALVSLLPTMGAVIHVDGERITLMHIQAGMLGLDEKMCPWPCKVGLIPALLAGEHVLHAPPALERAAQHLRKSHFGDVLEARHKKYENRDVYIYRFPNHMLAQVVPRYPGTSYLEVRMDGVSTERVVALLKGLSIDMEVSNGTQSGRTDPP